MKHIKLIASVVYNGRGEHMNSFEQISKKISVKHRTNRFTKANLFISLSHTPIHWSIVNSFVVYGTPSSVYTLHKLEVKIGCLFYFRVIQKTCFFYLQEKHMLLGMVKIIVKTPNALLIVHVFMIKRCL